MRRNLARVPLPRISTPFLATFVLALGILFPPPGFAQSSSPENPEETLTEASRRIAAAAMTEARALRWAQAEQQLFVAPLPTLAEHMTVRLVLNSRFAESTALEIQVSSAEGRMLTIGNEELRPRQTRELDLLAAVRSVGDGFQPTSAQVSFFGDKEMVQAWLLVSGEAGNLEVPLVSRNDESAWQWTTFWDTRLYEGARKVRPRVTFVNVAPEPVILTLEDNGAAATGRRTVVEIPGSGTFSWPPASVRRRPDGSLRVRHDGTPGQVLAGGYLEGPGFLAALPVVGSATAAETRIYDSPLLPLGPNYENRPILSLFHPGQEHRDSARVRVALIELASGHDIGTVERWLLPEEVQSLDLRGLMPTAFADPRRGVRVQVSSEGAPILAYGVSLAPEAAPPTDIALIPRQKVHESGTYPIPNLEQHQVETTILNLGDEAAELFGHLSWERGDYALAPIKISPGAAVRIDFQELIDQAEPDLQGRTFQPQDSPSYFQWLSRRGSSELIARTEIRPLNSADSYGFNCYGCCEEWPVGGIEPGFAAFAIGFSADFIPVEFIDTCSGTIGPYTAYPKSSGYSSPLGWNYNQVWASSVTNQMVSFSSDGLYMWVNCEERNRTFAGDAPAVAEDDCLEAFHPDFDVTRGCCGMHSSNVTACKDCCDKQLLVANCRCEKLMTVGAQNICKMSVKKANDRACHAPCDIECGDI